MSGLLSYSGLTTKIRAMQSHLLNDQNFREIVELESVPQAVSYLKQHKGYEDLFEGYNEADLHRGQIEKMLRLTVYRDFSKLYRFANVEQRKFLALYFKRYEVSVIKECLNTVFDHRDVVLNLSIFDRKQKRPRLKIKNRRNRLGPARAAHPRRIRRPLTSPSRPNETKCPEVTERPRMPRSPLSPHRIRH